MKASISSRMFLANLREMSSEARHWLPVLLSVVGLILSPRPAAGADCVLAPPGLVAWWTAQGDATDLVGTNHGTISGATFTAGKVGQAFSFNGGAGILVSDSAGLRPATQFTIEGWIKTPGILEGSMAGFIVARSGNAFTGYELLVGTPSQAGRLRFTINGGIGGADLFSTNSVTDDSIHHVAATYDGTMMRVYLDGVLDGQRAFNEPIVYQPGDPLWIGRREFASIPGYFIGLIDEFSIYHRALTADEIAAIYAAESAGKCLRRIEWFKIAGGRGESTNTSYRLRGTVGQHDAGGPLTNTMFSLVGGFWPPADESTAVCAPIMPGMIGWWRAEGNALDSAGTNHGTISGATFAGGKVGQAFSFDGLNDGISVADAASLRPLTNLTIEGWIKTPGIAQAAHIGMIAATYRDDGTFFNYGYEFFVDAPSNGGRLGFLINGGASGAASCYGTNTVTDNVFHHVAATYDGATMRLYRDGVLNRAIAYAQPIAYLPGQPLWIGRRQYAPIPGHFAGLIDELAIHSRALSLAELQAIHAAGSLGRCETRPTLHIAALPGAVRLTWTTNAIGYLLETNSALTLPAGWSVLTSNYSVIETNYAVTNTVGGETRFYRLHKP